MADDGERLSDVAASVTEAGPKVLWSLVLRGLVLPLVIFGYAFFSWKNETGFLPGRNGGADLYGLSAQWMALAVGALALFCHARWWWGAKGYVVTHEVLMKLALLAFLTGFFCAVVCRLGGV